jgi:hypothetical protein
VGLMLAMLTGGEGAPPAAQIQEITGYLEPGEREVYDLPNLKRGDTLYVYMQRLFGNLDPLFAIADSKYKLRLFDEQLKRLLQTEPENPFRAFRVDDSGSGTDAALQFPIPADGDYKIVVAGSRQPVGRRVIGQTFGGYHLVIGINAPQVLINRGTST